MGSTLKKRKWTLINNSGNERADGRENCGESLGSKRVPRIDYRPRAEERRATKREPVRG